MYRLTQISLCCALTLFAGLLFAQPSPDKAAIASSHHLATQAGFAVLEQGGNAFDAAIAVSAAIAVLEPMSSGIGGGGFWLLHFADSGRNVMVDGRETAPAAGTEDMYLDEQGEVVRDKSLNGPLSAGIPGEPAALAWIAEKYGALPLSASLAPAIRFAKEGFPVYDKYREQLANRRETLLRWEAAPEVFLVNGEVPPEGYILKQPDLADTLTALAEQGRAGFYSGTIAQELVKGVRAAGGIWTLEDLSNYRVVEREPIVFQYNDIKVISASPPSSGGVVLATMLNILEGYELDQLSVIQRKHVIVEAMRRAYRDRGIYLGDPDFVDMPIERLISDYYADGLRASIRMDRATPSSALPGIESETVGTDTSHFSVIDEHGNRVAATLTINLSFGSAFMPPGTGVLLNDEMNDFSSKPGVPNAYGLIGAAANAIAPGKRMLSSMTPSFAVDGDRIAVLGTPGGSRIITMVLLGLLDFADGNGPASWAARPRFHHQFLPDTVFCEPDACAPEVLEGLQALGHEVEVLDHTWGYMNAVMWDRGSGQVEAASDPRYEIGSGEARDVEPEKKLALPSSEAPEPLERVAPKYPRAAALQGVEGCVTATFDVLMDGSTDNFVIVDSKPEGVFDQATLRALSQWRYPKLEAPRRITQVVEYKLAGQQTDSPECMDADDVPEPRRPRESGDLET